MRVHYQCQPAHRGAAVLDDRREPGGRARGRGRGMRPSHGPGEMREGWVHVDYTSRRWRWARGSTASPSRSTTTTARRCSTSTSGWSPSGWPPTWPCSGLVDLMGTWSGMDRPRGGRHAAASPSGEGPPARVAAGRPTRFGGPGRAAHGPEVAHGRVGYLPAGPGAVAARTEPSAAEPTYADWLDRPRVTASELTDQADRAADDARPSPSRSSWSAPAGRRRRRSRPPSLAHVPDLPGMVCRVVGRPAVTAPGTSGSGASPRPRAHPRPVTTASGGGRPGRPLGRARRRRPSRARPRAPPLVACVRRPEVRTSTGTTTCWSAGAPRRPVSGLVVTRRAARRQLPRSLVRRSTAPLVEHGRHPPRAGRRGVVGPRPAARPHRRVRGPRAPGDGPRDRRADDLIPTPLSRWWRSTSSASADRDDVDPARGGGVRIRRRLDPVAATSR